VKLRYIPVGRKQDIIQIINKAYDKNGHLSKYCLRDSKLNKRTEAKGSKNK
jgi:hypothetical protein